MNNSSIQLVVTPKAINGEDIHGYMLRVSDLNGYKTPSQLLSLVDISNDSHIPYIFDVTKIAPLIGKNGQSLCNIGYVDRKDLDNPHPAEIKVMGHVVNRRYINIVKPKICPQCIEENGYVESAWSLQLFTVCPKHKQKLVDKCATCGKQISQYRQGVLRCQCGAKLNDMRGEVILGQRLLGLTKLLKQKLYQESLLKHDENHHKFPLKELDSISLNSLCWIIERLVSIQISCMENDTTTSDSQLRRNKIKVMRLAANILSNWPKGFHNLIDQVRGGLGDGEVKQLKARFKLLYKFLFHSSLPTKDIVFLQNEFLSYENSFAKTSFIDKRLTKSFDEELHLVGVAALSEELGVHPKTVHKLMEKGVIDAYGEMVDHRRRYIFDRSKRMPYKVVATENLSERDAAKLLGLPVSVLKELRIRKVYKITEVGDKVASYTRKCVGDLNKTIRRRIDLLSIDDYNPAEHILLCEVMRMKLGGPQYKAQFICEFMERKIIPLGIMCHDVARIIFDRQEVYKHLKANKVANQQGQYISDAAKVLRCDPTIIAVLVMDGYLEARRSRRGVIITEESLKNFANMYISCAWLAESLNTTTKKIMFVCEQKKIGLVCFFRNYGRSPQPFIHREHLAEFNLDSLPVYYEKSAVV